MTVDKGLGRGVLRSPYRAVGVVVWPASISGWVLLGLAGAGLTDVPSFCADSRIWQSPGPEALAFARVWIDPVRMAQAWALMLVAMMLPLLVVPLVHVRSRVLPRCRVPAQSACVAGYGLVWMTAGGDMIAAMVWIRLGLTDGWQAHAAVALAVLALFWQVTPWKQRALNRCHARPELRGAPRAALWDAWVFGLGQGVWCVLSCWALMALALAVPKWHLAAMAVVSLWIWAERLDPPARPSWRLSRPIAGARLLRRVLHAGFAQRKGIRT